MEATQTDQVSGLRAHSQKPRREAAAKSSGDNGTWAQGYVRSRGVVGLSRGVGGVVLQEDRGKTQQPPERLLFFWVLPRPLLPELQQKSHSLSHPITGSLKAQLSNISMPSCCYLCVVGWVASWLWDNADA